MQKTFLTLCAVSALLFGCIGSEAPLTATQRQVLLQVEHAPPGSFVVMKGKHHYNYGVIESHSQGDLTFSSWDLNLFRDYIRPESLVRTYGAYRVVVPADKPTYSQINKIFAKEAGVPK